VADETTAQEQPLYLTKVTVPVRTALGKLKVRDSYDWHQRAWDLFGGREDKKRDFLIRVDKRDDYFQMLILSAARPEKPTWCTANSFESKLIPDSFFNNSTFRFSLLVNPTKKIASTNKEGNKTKNGKRLPLTKREDLVQWLKRKASRGGFGFEAEKLQTIPRGKEIFHKKGNARGTLNAFEFLGELSITDVQKFRSTLKNGVGSAKAFGFGLILLSPIKYNILSKT